MSKASPKDTPPEPAAPTRSAFAHVECNAENVIIETVKPANDGDGIILRMFEAHGKAAATHVDFGVDVASCAIVTIFEETETALPTDGRTIDVTFSPFKIKTLRVVLAK